MISETLLSVCLLISCRRRSLLPAVAATTRGITLTCPWIPLMKVENLKASTSSLFLSKSRWFWEKAYTERHSRMQGARMRKFFIRSLLTSLGAAYMTITKLPSSETPLAFTKRGFLSSLTLFRRIGWFFSSTFKTLLTFSSLISQKDLCTCLQPSSRRRRGTRLLLFDSVGARYAAYKTIISHPLSHEFKVNYKQALWARLEWLELPRLTRQFSRSR